MPANSKKAVKDWVGVWFELLKERGFPTDVVLASSEPGSDQITKFKSYSHAQFDGVGLVIEHFRECGFDVQPPKLPENFRGNWWSKIFGLFKNLRFVPVFGAKWKAYSASNQNQSQIGQYVFKVLSIQTSQKIVEASRSAGVSVNSQLLWCLDQVLRTQWIKDSGPFYWMLPINMRGAASEKLDTSNHASWIWVDSLKAKSALEIQNQIKKRFQEGFHWGAWFGLNIGRFIGIRGMKFLLNQAAGIEEHWVGTFSNVGAWKLNADPVVIIIPTVPSTPLSVGCVTVQNRMGLSLHIHPNLKVNKQELENWLNEWIGLASGDEK